MNEQIAKLYQAYGLAMYQAQCVEREIGTLLVSSRSQDPVADLEQLFTSAYKHTLGRLIALIRAEMKVTPELENRFARALDQRNWLAHNYFWDRAGEVQSEEGRNSMIDELRLIAAEFDQLDADLMIVNAGWLKMKGLTREIVDRELADLRIQAANHPTLATYEESHG